MVFGSAAAIYIPTFYRLFSYGWKFADYSQGPLVLLAFLWLLWRQRRVLRMPFITWAMSSSETGHTTSAAMTGFIMIFYPSPFLPAGS